MSPLICVKNGFMLVAREDNGDDNLNFFHQLINGLSVFIKTTLICLFGGFITSKISQIKAN